MFQTVARCLVVFAGFSLCAGVVAAPPKEAAPAAAKAGSKATSGAAKKGAPADSADSVGKAKSAPPTAAKPATAAGKTAPAAAPAKKPAGADEDEDSDDELEDDIDLDEEPAVPPKQGTAEWYLRETTRLRLETPGKADDAEELEKQFRAQQQKIIDFSQKAIALVHKDEKKDQLFQVAARHLLEARLQLAMTGDEEQIAALYEDSRAFYKRKPGSPSAAVGAQSLCQLAYHHALNHETDAAQWRSEFVRQSKHYLKAFPRELVRSVPLAYTAGKLCEQGNQIEEALSCFDLLVQLAPETTHGSEAEAVARRLRLPGNPPQIAGQTLADEPFLLDDLLGKPVLIVFWSTGAKAFQEQLPVVLPTIRKAQGAGLQVVGISLDADRAVLESFIKKQKLDWTQLYFANPEEQGWNNPITTHYGVFELPAWWLLDANGNVTTTATTAATLKRDLAKLLETSGVTVRDDTEKKEVIPAAGTGTRKSSVPPSTEARTSVPEKSLKTTKKPARSE
ncbi:MAG: TlpA disulfide reductase family protein [Planctomycetota bacterium]|nr:TlpA disulfide reductase family protein [Planctomycetota bacterium]